MRRVVLAYLFRRVVRKFDAAHRSGACWKDDGGGDVVALFAKRNDARVGFLGAEHGRACRRRRLRLGVTVRGRALMEVVPACAAAVETLRNLTALSARPGFDPTVTVAGSALLSPRRLRNVLE